MCYTCTRIGSKRQRSWRKWRSKPSWGVLHESSCTRPSDGASSDWQFGICYVGPENLSSHGPNLVLSAAIIAGEKPTNAPASIPPASASPLSLSEDHRIFWILASHHDGNGMVEVAWMAKSCGVMNVSCSSVRMSHVAITITNKKISWLSTV